jgi:predicted metal-dependent hydrolase
LKGCKTTEKSETPYLVKYRNVKYPRLEFKTGTLNLILPIDYEKKEKFLAKHKKWIDKKLKEIQKAIDQTEAKQINNTRNLNELKEMVQALSNGYQKELNTKINRIYFKKMKTKWASCSQGNNLTVNTLLKYLPTDLIEYIIFHEIAHSIERKHNFNFWSFIRKKISNHEAKEKDLLSYWFMVQKVAPFPNTCANPTTAEGLD